MARIYLTSVVFRLPLQTPFVRFGSAQPSCVHSSFNGSQHQLFPPVRGYSTPCTVFFSFLEKNHLSGLCFYFCPLKPLRFSFIAKGILFPFSTPQTDTTTNPDPPRAHPFPARAFFAASPFFQEPPLFPLRSEVGPQWFIKFFSFWAGLPKAGSF